MDIRRRYYGHIKDGAIKIEAWIQTLAKDAIAPLMYIVDIVSIQESVELEQKLIDEYQTMNRCNVLEAATPVETTPRTIDEIVHSASRCHYVRWMKKFLTEEQKIQPDNQINIVSQLNMVRSCKSFRDRDVARKITSTFFQMNEKSQEDIILFLKTICDSCSGETKYLS